MTTKPLRSRPHKALGNNLSHDFIGLVNPLAALVAQREGDGVGDQFVAEFSDRLLVFCTAASVHVASIAAKAVGVVEVG